MVDLSHSGPWRGRIDKLGIFAWFIAVFVGIWWSQGLNPLAFWAPDEALNRSAALVIATTGEPFLTLPFADPENLRPSRRASDYRFELGTMPRVFLCAPQDFRNLCVIARTLEVLGYDECQVFDPERLVRERYGKSRARETRVVSAGAFEKVRWVRVEDPAALLAAGAGRTVATVADPNASRG